jgi:transcriptional regulator with XRE-family HTH domain
MLEETARKLGHRLRVLRAERGISLRDVEAKTGVHKQTISELERGMRKRPYGRTLAKLAHFYGVSTEELIEEATDIPLVAAPGEEPTQKSPSLAEIADMWESELVEAVQQGRLSKQQADAEFRRRFEEWKRAPKDTEAEVSGVEDHEGVRS